MTKSFAVTHRAVIAGAVGAALSAPMSKGGYAFAAAPGRGYSRRAPRTCTAMATCSPTKMRGSRVPTRTVTPFATKSTSTASIILKRSLT